MNLAIRSKESFNNFLFTLLGFEKAKRKGTILLMILLHVAGWCLLFFLPLFFYPVRINNDCFFVLMLAEKLVLVGIFYLNYYVLIPRLFEQKKYFRYFVFILFLFIAYVTQLVLVRTNNLPIPRLIIQQESIPSEANRYFIPFDNGTTVALTDSNPYFRRELPMQDPTVFGIPRGLLAMPLSNAISSFALILIMGGFIRLAYSFIRNQHEKKALENANLNAEVNFLKSQINPHFLFNTLNGIYSQAHTKSAHTEHSILKLSDLLRYMLYDSGEDKVELTKDIQYISNYIDLQRLRLSQKVSIQYEIEGDTNRKKIAPLLLITFIENAFKHGISYSKPSVINIHIRVFQETLTLMVSNPIVETNSFAGGGLGLKNAVRRLDLLYPSDYSLDIDRNDQSHIVNLKINLNRD